ncbi:MHS family proline/betaine transporter-like MFS transporter [Angulomicrobium tetraedrale]|uniref:MHS family proline/betaine transporter-like MFS transporter n=1 Tax=Ancylobacter tetraedralis TaxID=217068 RepID=A0A839Z6Y9_9HYPH|nr:MHS family proline/betaine transporter-like MFS transporter [Ancylobacter tetraedralis]
MSVSSLDDAGYRDTGPAARRAAPGALLAGALGNALEWYDFAAYGFLAAIFARNFFPASDAFVGLIAAFGIFAASFLMRPIGGVLFGHIGDNYGRRPALFISAAMMTASTVAIGLLPTYATIGALAPVLLLMLRLLQGLSIGGEYTTSAIFLAENAAPGRRGLVASFAGCGASGGTLLGSMVGAVTALMMSTDDLIAWGWRIPFLLGIVLGGFTLYLRNAAIEHGPPRPTRAPGAKAELPLMAALRSDGADMARAAALNLTLGAGFYMLFVYLTTYMQQVDGLTQRLSLQINTISMIAVLVLAPMFAALSDRVGRKPVIIAGLVGMVLFSWPLFRLLESGAQGALLGQLGFAVLTACYAGPIPATLVEMFRPGARCTALSLSYNVALGLAGGTAPMVAVYLVNREAFDMGPAVYLIGISLVSLAAALTLKERSGASLT